MNQPTKILIIGATSAIAHETAKLFARDKAELYLVGRSPEKSKSVQNDLLARGATSATCVTLDLAELGKHEKLITTAVEKLGRLDAVLIAHGSLGEQALCEQDVAATLSELTTNCLSVISLLTILANYFEKQKKGCIAVISSVAGERGRKSNYVYGTAKGAVSIFLQGLRNRLASSGVRVVTIKPGFVDTPMTAAIPKNALFAKPGDVGAAIYKAMQSGKEVVYTPGFWWPIMVVIKSIPESIFKKLSL